MAINHLIGVIVFLALLDLAEYCTKVSTLAESGQSMDYTSLLLVALPVVIVVLVGILQRSRSRKHDTMQRNSGKAVHNSTKLYKEQQQQQQQQQDNSALKSESSDSGISTNGHQHQHHHHHHQQQQQQHQHHNRHQQQQRESVKQRKARNGLKRPDGQKRPTEFAMDEWLEGQVVVYDYDCTFISSCAEDGLMTRHHSVHRNSTSSDAAASDDMNSSSSNEDLSASFAVLSKANKKPSKSRQRRQQKRNKQGNNLVACPDGSSTPAPMDIDDEGKENERPVGRSGKAAVSNASLRKQCTRSAAFKAAKNANANGNGSGKCSANALATSSSNSSVCSTLSSDSLSTCSLSSSVSSSTTSSPSNSMHCSPTASPTASKRCADDLKNFKRIARALAPPLRQHIKLSMSEPELVQHLRRYIIDPNLLRVYGYPVESAIHDGCIEIYKCLPKSVSSHHHYTAKTNVINTNDGLSVGISTVTVDQQWSLNDASNSSIDSGQGSCDSSPPSVDSDASEGGEEEATTTAFYTPDGSYQIFSQYDQSLEKQCVRCKRSFHVTASGEYLSREACVFHWGKLNHMYTANNGFGYQYSCCQGEHDAEGCSRNALHVWTGAVVGLNGPYTDFVHTRPRKTGRRPTKVYAVDCEMSFTGRGLEATKVTVVGYDGQLVYEHFIRPEAEIVDYNTRFSGITEKDLCTQANKSVKTLSEVQRDLLQLFDADTILIGHGLDNDLRVLRLVHKTIIDTSIAFPHSSGFPYRRALKHLTKMYLHRDIQCSDSGHSSFEDSRACLELILWKVRKDMRAGWGGGQ